MLSTAMLLSVSEHIGTRQKAQEPEGAEWLDDGARFSLQNHGNGRNDNKDNQCGSLQLPFIPPDSAVEWPQAKGRADYWDVIRYEVNMSQVHGFPNWITDNGQRGRHGLIATFNTPSDRSPKSR